MRFVWLLSLCLLAACSPAPLPSSGTGGTSTSPLVGVAAAIEINGDVPGVMTLPQFKEKYATEKVKWRRPEGSSDDTRLLADLSTLDGQTPTYVGVPVAEFVYRFFDGMLEEIVVNPEDLELQTLQATLARKYGPPEEVLDPMLLRGDLWRSGTVTLGVYTDTFVVIASDTAIRDRRLKADAE